MAIVGKKSSLSGNTGPCSNRQTHRCSLRIRGKVLSGLIQKLVERLGVILHRRAVTPVRDIKAKPAADQLKIDMQIKVHSVPKRCHQKRILE